MKGSYRNPTKSVSISAREHYPRWTFWVFPVLILSMVGAMLTWNALIRYQEFSAYQQRIMDNSVNGTSAEISVFLSELRRSIHLFADKESALIDRVATNPDDSDIFEQLGTSVRKHFPESFAYTIADKTGTPLIEDFDGLVGEVCIKDMQTFATGRSHSKVYIHPHPTQYHFDIMVDRGHGNGSDGIFFVSFTTDILSRILKHGEVPGHRLILLKQDIPGLIEVTADGARIELQREFKLSTQEMERIGHSVAIKGTLWDLIDLPDADLYTGMRNDILRETILIFLMFITAGGIMFWLLVLSQSKRRKLEYLYNHDPVTGLPNRNFFAEQFLYMTRSKTTGHPEFALMLIDTGSLRNVKGDFFEQHTNDEMKRNVSERLERALCDAGILARIEDTYYATLLPGTSTEQLESVSRDILSSLHPPFGSDNGFILDNPCIGIAIYPENGRDLDTLMRHANMQIYGNRKQRRKDLPKIFTPDNM